MSLSIGNCHKELHCGLYYKPSPSFASMYVKVDILKKMIRFAYSSRIEVAESDMREVLIAATLLGFINLAAACVPQRITRRIQNQENVDIAELLPENYRFQELREDPCCSHSRHPLSRRALVTDILVWVEGYSLMVAVLAPLYFHEFMAYQRFIMRASQNYEGARPGLHMMWHSGDRLLLPVTFTGVALIQPCTTKHLQGEPG